MHTMHLLTVVAIQPNLKLKTRLKQLQGSLLLVIALPAHIDGRHRLYYSIAPKEFHLMLAKIGCDPGECAEHSAKHGAATAALQAGINEPIMSSSAGWSMQMMVALYTDWPASLH